VLFRMAVECSTAGPDPKAEHLVDAAALLGTIVICVGKVATLDQCKYLPNMVFILLYLDVFSLLGDYIPRHVDDYPCTCRVYTWVHLLVEPERQRIVRCGVTPSYTTPF
jgi:hypothetical protein